MKEVLERLVGLIPTYFEALLPLLSGPKRFVLAQVDAGPSALQQALLFLGVSFLLQWVLKLPLERGDPLLALGTDTVFVLFLVMSYGGVLFASWRLVGAALNLRNFFTLHFYYSAIFLILQALMFLAMMGTIRTLDPALYTQLFDAAYGGNAFSFMVGNRERLAANTAYRASMVVQGVGMAVIVLWMFAGWGAYRQLGRVSRTRSFLAAVFFAALCVPVMVVTNVVANALVK